jgi:hypothetical protein
MSQSLYWKPIKPQRHSSLPSQLKFILQKRYDGLETGESIILGEAVQPYLEGLADAGIEGAKELIAAIKRHEQVEIWVGS